MIRVLLLSQLSDSSSEESEDLNRGDGPPLSSDFEPESDPSEDPIDDWIELADLDKDPKPISHNPAMAEQAVSVQAAVAVLVTSPVLREEPRTIPHQVYTDLVRECDMMYGQNMELRRLVESMAGGPTQGIPASVSASDAHIRIRALIEITTRRIGDLASTSREDRDPKGMTCIVKWLVKELHALGGYSG